ncbi:TIGR02530 family flagellar biosynthesis protein [Inconstantimicrobium mannanitabidum]|uniref:Flagellar biosynthesis protein n=1 Tax=Inconstantimicrobium mannanitabidum TaxID=1604901 RepID=A0ACB5R8H1_9CLOT|nr:TIGR02530 family flagellar biosynthesis protein [Clostridium sp. TW13]GKX65493.1 flagellar biosynthesis protein [Clostridium sp. TW13]
MGYRIVNGQVYSVGKINVGSTQQGIDSVSGKNLNQKVKDANFSELLKNEISKTSHNAGYTISNHAAERLKGVQFSSEDYNSIATGLEKAREKGSKNTLMLYKNMAIVASVENNTIITAIDNERAKDNVFTNIDSVVIL